MPASEAEGRAQDYMPERRCYYRPGDRGYEREVRERLKEWDGALTSAPTEEKDVGSSGSRRTRGSMDRN
jgi:hypothetical protein